MPETPQFLSAQPYAHPGVRVCTLCLPSPIPSSGGDGPHQNSIPRRSKSLLAVDRGIPCCSQGVGHSIWTVALCPRIAHPPWCLEVAGPRATVLAQNEYVLRKPSSSTRVASCYAPSSYNDILHPNSSSTPNSISPPADRTWSLIDSSASSVLCAFDSTHTLPLSLSSSVLRITA